MTYCMGYSDTVFVFIESLILDLIMISGNTDIFTKRKELFHEQRAVNPSFCSED